MIMEIKERKLGYIVKNKYVIGLSINLEYSNKLISLPESIGSLISLKILDLSNNKLSGLPEWIHLYYDDELPPDMVLTQMSSLQRKLFTTLDLKRFIKK